MFPILNSNRLDLEASRNSANSERTIRQHEAVIDGNTVTVDHTYFRVGECKLRERATATHLPPENISDSRIVLEAISGLVIQQENGWLIVNDVTIPFRSYSEQGDKPQRLYAGGRAEGVMIEADAVTGHLEIAAFEKNIVGVFLSGNFIDPDANVDRLGVIAQDLGPMIGELNSTALTPDDGDPIEVPGGGSMQSILDAALWRQYKIYVETSDDWIAKNFPSARADLDVIAMTNAVFAALGFDASAIPEYTQYITERSKARLASAGLTKALTYSEIMAKIKNDASGKPRFDDEWVSEALQDSVISVGNVIEALDAQGFAFLIGGNADEIIEQVKAHYLELADVVEGYSIESENGRHLIALKGDSRPKPTANQIRRRACLKAALGTINAVLLADKAYRLSLADAWDHSKKAMVLTDDQHEVWPVVATAFHIEGYEQDPQLDSTKTIELLGEVLNSLLTRQETGMRIESIEWFDETYEIPVGAWEAVADQNGKFNFITLGGRPVQVDMGAAVEGFDPTEYLIGLGELEIVGRQLKTEVLDPTVVNGLAESHPILRLRFNGDAQAFIIILDNGQPVRAEDVLAVGGWLATELNSVLIARGDTEARLKVIDDNMSSSYTVSSYEVANATYGPVMVSAR